MSIFKKSLNNSDRERGARKKDRVVIRYTRQIWSGMYFYKIQMGEFSDIKKMIKLE